ncbi:MAG: hypothetical protein ACLFPQ_03205 [Candidatus Woesearchaeota archaeon]
MDSNKNVIYAKDSQGNYIGRNRTVLTDKGFLCTRFYNNGSDYDLGISWLDYLIQFGQKVNADIIIPKIFTNPSIDNQLRKNNISSQKIQAEIQPSYFNLFYGDGLDVSKNDNTLTVSTDAYIIPVKK